MCIKVLYYIMCICFTKIRKGIIFTLISVGLLYDDYMYEIYINVCVKDSKRHRARRTRLPTTYIIEIYKCTQYDVEV